MYPLPLLSPTSFSRAQNELKVKQESETNEKKGGTRRPSSPACSLPLFPPIFRTVSPSHVPTRPSSHLVANGKNLLLPNLPPSRSLNKTARHPAATPSSPPSLPPFLRTTTPFLSRNDALHLASAPHREDRRSTSFAWILVLRESTNDENKGEGGREGRKDSRRGLTSPFSFFHWVW